jgi:hypothetical protein
MPPSSTALVENVTFPTSRDVGYKYVAVFDGSPVQTLRFPHLATYAAIFDGCGHGALCSGLQSRYNP